MTTGDLVTGATAAAIGLGPAVVGAPAWVFLFTLPAAFGVAGLCWRSLEPPCRTDGRDK